jgi:hypothetical protein
MSRLVLLCERPRHLSRQEALDWFSRAVAQLADGGEVLTLELTELETASRHWSCPADLMVEAQLGEVDAGRLVESPRWRGLLGDLRLLGMRPAVAIADPKAVPAPGKRR